MRCEVLSNLGLLLFVYNFNKRFSYNITLYINCCPLYQ